MKLEKAILLASEGFPEDARVVARIIAEVFGFTDAAFIDKGHVDLLRAQLRKHTWKAQNESQVSPSQQT